MHLRTPGQRLPSQPRLTIYRIACKSQVLDNEEPNVINMCASAIIAVFEVGKMSLAKARLASVSALARFRRSANAKPTTEKRRSTVAEVAGTPRYCRAMRARLGLGEVLDMICPPAVDTIPARRSDIRHITHGHVRRHVI